MNLTFSIKTHRPGVEYSGEHFFVLNKGLNSGKPMEEPCPNCYVCECKSAAEKEQIYWVFYSLWQGNKFREIQIGSVIPFIRKKETIDLVKQAIHKNKTNPDLFGKAVSMLRGIDDQITKYNDLSRTLKSLKIALVSDLVR